VPGYKDWQVTFIFDFLVFLPTMMKSSLLLVLATTVAAWSEDVHNQIGFMAETFLTPSTTAMIKQILEPMYEGSIGRAAAWADSFDHTPAGAFSSQWHWIDSSDNVSYI
jgi:hypothetical protein